MSKRCVGLIVGGLLTACSGSSGRHPDAAADAPPDVATRTMSGHDIIHLLTPTGSSDVPSNLSRATIEVLAAPSFTAIYGTGNADGTFSVPDVPIGEYYFVAGTHYFVGSADTIDLDTHHVGRADDIFVNQPTNLTFTLTGMSAWQVGDEIEMYSPESGTLAFDLEAAATSGAPVANDTALNGMVYDLRNASRNTAPSAAAGDTVTIAHLSKATDGTRTYEALEQSFVPTGLEVANGGSASISGAFSNVATTKNLTVTWDRPAFAADLAAHFPHADSRNFSTFAVTALQQASTLGFYDGGPDLLFFAPGYTTDTSAVAAAWTYGDPFPTDWGRIAWNRYYKFRFISLPGAQPAAIYARLFSYRDLSTLAADPMFEPGIGVVVNPTINGSDALALAAITGTGTTPTLKWEAPAIGTPAKYYVNVYSVLNESGTTSLQTVAILETTDPQLAIPPMLLTAGQPYVFEIEAHATSVDVVAQPFAHALPEAYSTVTTTMVTP